MLTVENPALFNQVYSISGYNADPVLTVCCVLYFLHMHQCIWALAKLQKHSIKDNQKRAAQGGIWNVALMPLKIRKKRQSYKNVPVYLRKKIYCTLFPVHFYFFLSFISKYEIR